MKSLKILASVAIASVLLTGCSTTKNLFAKRDNGSLDYRSAKTLEPLKLPANQPAADFVPLYPVPKVVGELPNFVNESGKQYQLPKPPSVR